MTAVRYLRNYVLVLLYFVPTFPSSISQYGAHSQPEAASDADLDQHISGERDMLGCRRLGLILFFTQHAWSSICLTRANFL